MPLAQRFKTVRFREGVRHNTCSRLCGATPCAVMVILIGSRGQMKSEVQILYKFVFHDFVWELAALFSHSRAIEDFDEAGTHAHSGDPLRFTAEVVCAVLDISIRKKGRVIELNNSRPACRVRMRF